MKKLLREFIFDPEEIAEVAALAAELNLTNTTAGILYSRGMNTAEKARAFLDPSREHLLSPFLMSGMKEAVELLSRAQAEEWNVAVYGDYDADGIGACAILSRALRIFGIEPYLFVPERSEGYGMSVATVDKIFDEFLPDLIVTVDCGISNRKEVEYIKEQGAYVIVTDHHELPEELPDCIVVNPKLKDDYPYDNLCGAGVAFKLATALIGEKAYALLDFAALSTVADSVPLTHENRDIVAEGLKLLENPRPAFAALIGKSKEISATTLAFSVAPRVNAAGRMGDARAALDLFTTDDEDEIAYLAEKLNRYNTERQRACDELYTQAAEAVRREGAYGNVIVVAGEGWNAGFVGIVAARIVEEFCRPALLFVKNGDMLRGSARSISGVNIFEALKACSEHIEEFGGHAQAAGVNVRVDEFEALKKSLDEYIGAHYSESDFLPTITVVGEGENGVRLAHEIAALEPFGMGNPRPMFSFEAERIAAGVLKPDSPHVSFSEGKQNYMYFGGAKDLRLLRSDLKKTVVYEYNLSRYNGREYLKGFVRSVLYDGTSGQAVELTAFENALRALAGEEKPVTVRPVSEVNAYLAEKRKACRYGLCAVCFDRSSLASYPAAEGLPVDCFTLSSGSVGNTVLYAPDRDVDLSAFRDVVFLDKPAATTYRTGNATVTVGDICGYRELYTLDTTREGLLSVFAAIRAYRAPILGERGDYAAIADGCGSLGFDVRQFIFALAVFDELGLLIFEGGQVKLARGKKTELSDSRIYARVLHMQEE